MDLIVCRFSDVIEIRSFFVGGRQIEVSDRPSIDVFFTRSAPVFKNDQNGRYHVHHAYVQAFLPAPGDLHPIILHHGGGMTGAMWETTPDGREGWLNLFLKAGHPSYVIDNVERGRAGWPAMYLDDLGPPILRPEQEAWSLFRFGAPEDYATLQPFADQRFPVDCLAGFSAHLVPRWLEHSEHSAHTVYELLDRTGPAVVVAHSQGTECVLAAAASRPRHVRALVLVEPSAIPENIDFIVENSIPTLIVTGDYLDCSRLWRELSKQYHGLVRNICDRGGIAEVMDLTKEIGPGFSHMLMMDRGNELAFNHVRRWIEASVPYAAAGKPLTRTDKW